MTMTMTMKRSLKIIFLKTCFAIGLFKLTKFLVRKKLLILCYHGFESDDESVFRPKLFIKKETFEKRMQLLSKYCFNVLSLDSGLNGLETDSLTGNSIAITIDDGFYNVLDFGAKCLKSNGYPATLYLTTYYSVNQLPVFNLFIQYCFWKTKKMDPDFSIFPWLENSDFNLALSHAESREGAIANFIEYCEANFDLNERRDICVNLSAILDIDYDRIVESRILSLVSPEEARELFDYNVDLQLHTHRHNFSTEDLNCASAEISENRQHLEMIKQSAYVHFCYPSGVWDTNQWQVLESLKVKSATTCVAGFNTKHTRKYALNRFLDGENISEIEFVAEIFGFLEVMRELKRIFSKL